MQTLKPSHMYVHFRKYTPFRCRLAFLSFESPCAQIPAFVLEPARAQMSGVVQVFVRGASG